MKILPIMAVAAAIVTQAASAAPVYWNVFNIEEEESLAADIVTYGSLGDMLGDTNRISVNTISGFGRNIVGSGASIAVKVPEPATLTLFGLGLAGGVMCAVAHARRQAANAARLNRSKTSSLALAK